MPQGLIIPAARIEKHAACFAKRGIWIGKNSSKNKFRATQILKVSRELAWVE
jgi:hypothetical protein